MKKASLLASVLVLSLLLAACGSASPAGNTFRTSTSGLRALTPEARLALGTIKLDEGKQAIDARTAVKLIPLWQLMLQLMTSSSTAPQEVTAVLDEIRRTMTTQQIAAIEGMTLTQADIFSAFQSQNQANSSGGGTGSGGNGFEGSGSRRNGGNFVFAGPGPEGPGGGGGIGGNGLRGSTSSGSNGQANAAQAAEATQSRENAIAAALIGQVIKLLQVKAQG